MSRLSSVAILPRAIRGTKGRTSALMQGSINILRAAQAWDDIVAATAPLRILRIVDESGPAPVTADFAAHEIGLDAFGCNTPNHALAAALAARAAACPNVTLLDNTRFEALDNNADGVTAHTSKGVIHARLCVAGDGRESAVRQAAGIGARRTDFGQQAITCLIDHSKPHDAISTEFHRPGGPFTLVPLPGNRSSVVWVDFTAPAERHQALSKPDFTVALQQRSANALGRITLASPPSAFPLMGLSADSLTAPRVALIAEAAHVLHPLGAQGLNLSLRDAAFLAETIADAMRLGEDPGSAAVLASYARKRRADLAFRHYGTNGLNQLVSRNAGLVKALRRTGLQTVAGIAPLKHLAMREGLAPGQDSRLAQGQPL